MIRIRPLVISLFVSLLLTMLPIQAFTAEDINKIEDEGVYTGLSKPATSLGSNKDQRFNQSADESRTLPKGAFDKPLGDENGKHSTESQKAVTEMPAKKGKIILRTEPADSMVTLNWKVTDFRQKQGDAPLKFTVYYGQEPGRYDKKIEVGTTQQHILRGLKNNQIYYLKVQGTARVLTESADESEAALTELTLFSNEEKVTPLALDELGSALERTFAGKTFTLQDKIETTPFNRELKQFGYDFFKNSVTAGTPLENMPVGPDYVIGPGDSLRIDLWGSVQARSESTVDRNGEITIPRIGSVKVWGITFAQAKEVINKAVSRYYKGYELNVTLGRLRAIQVYVVGEVESPGTYSVSSTGTVLNALSLAGGPSKNGSLRSIRLTRSGKVQEEIDLYDMFLAGDRHKDVRLENGDTIFVPVIGMVVAVAGEVKRSGIYELKAKTPLSDVIRMAGGITAAGDTSRIQVERFEGNVSRVVVDYEPKNNQTDEMLGSVDILDRDMVKVFPVNRALRQVVTVQGNVARPGEYQYRPGMKVSDVISSHAALMPDAYLSTAQVIRLVPPDFHKETLSFNLGKVLTSDPGENLVLQEQDTVRVFSRQDMEEKQSVAINGLVLNPGVYDYYPNMTVRDLVSAAGSVKRNAFLDNAELTRIAVFDGVARGTRLSIDLRKALAGDPVANQTLQADDVLIVRGIVEWLESADRFVTLKGEVRYPGIYSITKGERLSSVILRAGGFTEKAFLKGAKFTRKSVQKDQQKRMDEIIQRSEQDILRKQGELAAIASSKEELEATKAALEGLQKSLEKLRTMKAEGRVVINFAQLDTFTNGPYDLELFGGDVLELPPTPNVVNVLGQVYNQTTLVHRAGENVSYYLTKSGGTTRDGAEDEMYIIRADGSVFSRQQSSFGIRWDESSSSWTFGGFMANQMLPGDTLVVPQKLERTAWLREIKDISQIFANVALTAGTILIGLK